MRFLHSIARTNTDFPAGTIGPIDLPVNPLSLIMLCFELTNAAPAAVGTYSAIDDLLDNVTSVIVKHKGESIMQGNLRDLAIANMLNGTRFLGWDRLTDASGGIRRVGIPLSFARRQYDPDECFPPTSRGNLTIELARAANPSAFTDVNLQIETVELIEANPKKYLKVTTTSATAVVGQYDVALPIGNPLLRLIYFDTALASLTTATSSWGQVKLLKDNIEQYYPLSDAQTLACMMNMQTKNEGILPGHTHQYDGSSAGVAASDDAKEPVSQGMRGYFQMDFDPLGGDEYLLETTGAADLKVRAIGTSATAVRVLPVELVTIGK
jgi:hypothetical protein